jgi:hypothetical protein
LGSRAIYEVLLRKVGENSSPDEGSSLSGSSGRERPARTALSLVLDGGDGTLSSPVNVGSESVVDYFGNRFVGLGDVHAAGPVAELLDGLIGELIKSNGEASSLRVEGVNEVIVVSEDRVSVSRFGEGLVHLTVLGLPLVEGFCVFLFGDSVYGSKESD